ncbi:hypothetical protein [Pleurocapsa sp. CCALA 161]|nr:hypothetical protein [Pleurocapsa sp. CCALA 161]
MNWYKGIHNAIASFFQLEPCHVIPHRAIALAVSTHPSPSKPNTHLP